MRDRHFPRLCRSCHGPMARQDDACWRCGARWVVEEQSATILRLPVRTTLTVSAGAAGLDVDRWATDGGTAAVQKGAVTAAGAVGRR
jgi:hypothetical protein